MNTPATTSIYIAVVTLILWSHLSCCCQAFVTPSSSVAQSISFGAYQKNSVPIRSIELELPPTSLSLATTDITSSIGSPLLLSNNEDVLKSIATGLGYLIGAASVLLYTPIAIRIIRTKSADGLSISTFWLKLVSYTCTDVYNIKNKFPISAFSESLVISVEAAIVLGLITKYQQKLDAKTLSLTLTYVAITSWALLAPESIGPSNDAISFAQEASILLNAAALMPQLYQNFQRKAAGDYSPITASLASVGCTIRLFTTIELTNGDPLLLVNYGVALALNLSLLLQIIYYGTQKEGKTLSQLYLADVKSE